jgi:hypothetical protein
MEETRAYQRKDSVSKTPADYEIVFQLSESQASDPSILFPPGCPVCFDHTNLSVSEYYATEGVVTSVSMGRDPSKPMSASMIIIYNVEWVDVEANKSSSQFFQENLAYAYNFPVYVTVDDNGEKIKAEIAFSQRVAIDKSEGHTSLTYIIVSRNGGRIRFEKGVKQARIRYRRLIYQMMI